jgi:hypothetical protein
VCPQCGSVARLGRDLCVRCLLALGIAASGDSSQALDDLLHEINVPHAEHLSGNLVGHFP